MPLAPLLVATPFWRSRRCNKNLLLLDNKATPPRKTKLQKVRALAIYNIYIY
jgi:hypothetical protein